MNVKRTLLRAGQTVAVTADEGTDLLEVLHHSLRIASLGRGCHDGGCGACRVLLDGALVNACTVRLGDVPEGATLEAYEDIEHEPAAVTAVAAFTKERPTRCMLCVPQVGVTAVSLARRGALGDRHAVARALESASCTCTGRGSLRRALLAK